MVEETWVIEKNKMLLPVYINIIIETPTIGTNIVASVVDLHPSMIEEIISQPDGFVSIRTKKEGWVKLGVSFLEIIKFYKEHQNIDMRFAESVDLYYKDNYKEYKEIKNNNNKGGYETSTS